MSLTKFGQFTETDNATYASTQQYNPQSCTCIAGARLQDVSSFTSPINWTLTFIGGVLRLVSDLDYKENFAIPFFKEVDKVSLTFDSKMNALVAISGTSSTNEEGSAIYKISSTEITLVKFWAAKRFLSFANYASFDNRLQDQTQTIIYLDGASCVIAQLKDTTILSPTVMDIILDGDIEKNEIHQVGYTSDNKLKVQVATRI